jgi:hypothetical protein
VNVCNEKTFGPQIFFAPDTAEREWTVVIKKESRSRKGDWEEFDGILGAVGRCFDPIGGPNAQHSMQLCDEGEEINEAHVRVERWRGRMPLAARVSRNTIGLTMTVTTGASGSRTTIGRKWTWTTSASRWM